MTEKAEAIFAQRPTIRETTISALQEQLRLKVWKLQALEKALADFPCNRCGGEQGSHQGWCPIGKILNGS